MNAEQKKTILAYIAAADPAKKIVSKIEPSADFRTGSIRYNKSALVLHREISLLTDEEYVRAFLIVRLITELGYGALKTIELEKSYSIGRPSAKAARVDLLVKYPDDWAVKSLRGAAFLFIECKAPNKFESDRDFLKGQLFDLAKQESPCPNFAVYYTALVEANEPLDRALIINFNDFSSWDRWDSQGQPANSILPVRYGVPRNIEYANTGIPSVTQRPLRTNVTRGEFDRLRKELHDVVWGGGGTNNNDVFVILIRLFLCKVFDELETSPNTRYRFQRVAYTNGEVESPEQVKANMTLLFREAAETYLGYSPEDLIETTPFESKKVSPAKVAFVVGRLQGLSLTKNTSRGDGDLLGDFFEGIVSQDFTQTKGQFFTHINLVKFCLELSDFSSTVSSTFLTERDAQGRPRIPKVIDPSCGSGTFLVEAMKAGTAALVPLRSSGGKLQRRLREYAQIWFGEDSQNSWAREFIYGIEPNADLGLATKVNMILHGDGSTNIFVNTGLAAFSEYALTDRSHGLALTKRKGPDFPYQNACNEEFDFILTNPPFSITLSTDEKKDLAKSFGLDAQSASEHLFIERWYQLLRAGGKVVAIIPETIFDSSSSLEIRKFILQYFRVTAIVSLPYVAFKPFTSTKTCIMLAEKKTDAEVLKWRDAWDSAEIEYRSVSKALRQGDRDSRLAAARELLTFEDAALVLRDDVLERFEQELEHLQKDGSSWTLSRAVMSGSVEDQEIFLSEPTNVGYRRRKGLPDLVLTNDLISTSGPSVLAAYKQEEHESLRYGFRVKLSDLCVRPGLRMDPKFLHLWVKRAGKIFASRRQHLTMRDMLQPYKPTKLSKGTLEQPRLLIDLANVEAKMSIISGVVEVDEIGSDKIEFGASEIAISKLEPYLGKVLVNDPSKDWIGSPEWLTYKRTERVVDIDYIRFILLSPEILEVYRCLQSGKRHARMSEADFLSLKIPSNSAATQAKIAAFCREKMQTILGKRSEIGGLRSEIDMAILWAMGGASAITSPA